MNLRVFATVLAAALVAALGWWVQDRIHPREPVRNRIAADTPDYFIEHFTAIAMNRQGRPRSRLSADALRHYPADGHADLTRPRMTFFRRDGAPWRVDAVRGKVSGDDRLVDLLGTTHVRRAATAANRAISIETSNLRVRPGDDYAETAEHAVIRSADSTLQGTGLRAWFGEGRLQLLSKVRGTYRYDKP